MLKSEAKIQDLEQEFIRHSGRAFASARREALANGLSVLHVENGSIIQVESDGTKHKVKDIAARKPAPVVRRIRLH
jgi:hypothetical protein